MVETKALLNYVKDSGMTMQGIAKKMGISFHSH